MDFDVWEYVERDLEGNGDTVPTLHLDTVADVELAVVVAADNSLDDPAAWS